MRNVAALRAEHLVRQILRLFLGAPRRRRPPSKTEVRPRSRHPRRHPLSTGHRRGAPTAASCVKASSSSEGASPFLLCIHSELVICQEMNFTRRTSHTASKTRRKHSSACFRQRASESSWRKLPLARPSHGGPIPAR